MSSVPLFKVSLVAGLIFSMEVRAQTMDSIPSHRKTIVISTIGGLSAGTLIALDQIWYADFPRSSFQFVDDNAQWLQMDKVGHSMSAYYLGALSTESFRWARYEDKKARWLGAGSAWLYMMGIEVLDGFSAEWGASSGDIIANTSGIGLLVAQDALWTEQRITFKYGFQSSDLAQYRPEVLGSTWNERWLKDYNGQSYWLSANIASFMSDDSNMPKWLNVAVGYGVNGMLNGEGDFVYVSDDHIIPSDPRRQWYLAPDIDLWRIQTKHKGLRTALRALGFIRLPLPALKLEQGRLSVEGFLF